MNQRGDVVPMVVVAILVLVTFSMLAINTPVRPAPSLPIDTSRHETQISIEKSVDLGIQKWLENGFSQKDPKWYNNASFPPDLNESKSSARLYVKEQIDFVLDVV